MSVLYNRNKWMIIVMYVTLSYIVSIISSHIDDQFKCIGVKDVVCFTMELYTLVLVKLMQKVVFVMHLHKKN